MVSANQGMHERSPSSRRRARTAALLACGAGCLAVLAATVAKAAERNDRPAVLFVRGVHAEYVAQPLHQRGFAVDTCGPGELAARLKSGSYNVVVVGGAFDEAPVGKPLERFLQRGGGVLLTAPDRRFGGPGKDSQQWQMHAQWLAERGARTRVEDLKETDPANRATDTVGMQHSWTPRVRPPVSEGVKGVWTMARKTSRGMEAVTSFAFADPWRAVVRGTKSLKTIPPTHQSHTVYEGWMRQTRGQAPALMGVREYKKGRLAAVGIRNSLLFRAPPNCPTTERMLTEGFADRPSGWLRVLANTFRWLAEPSRKKGMGGAETPEEVIHPPVNTWSRKPRQKWPDRPKFPDQPQSSGLIGARTELSTGSGTVGDYVREAKQAGLDYLVFLEKLAELSRDEWDKLVQACGRESGDEFLAVPGLTYRDAQGNHLFVFADNVQYPPEKLLLPGRRLDTTTRMRLRALRKYVHDMLQMKAIRGFWRHDDNYVHHAEYHYGSSIAVKSFIDGEPVDDAFDAFSYMNGIGHLPGTFAFEIMHSPGMVSERAANGWRTVALRPLGRLDGKWHRATKTFSGRGAHYITNGPAIETWQRFGEHWTRGQWYRPDLNQIRLRLAVRSDAGLKRVTIYNGQRVFRRWRPDGKTFRREVVRANVQQKGLFVVVEDQKGRRAVSQAYYTRNLLLNEILLGDRCNYRAHCRLRDDRDRFVRIKAGFRPRNGLTPNRGKLRRTQRLQPAASLTRDTPQLPKDGEVVARSATLQFSPGPPAELNLFAYPKPYLIGPDMGIGQALLRYGYDPAEKGAKKTPLGYEYDEGQKAGWIAWGTWYKLIPTRVFEGHVRTYAANWEPYGLRIGWKEADVTLKKPVEQTNLNVMSSRGKAKQPWHVYRGGKRLAGPESGPRTGRFTRGTYAVNRASGGSTMVIALGDALRFRYAKGGERFSLFIPEEAGPFEKGDRVRYRVGLGGAPAGTSIERMRRYAEAYGVATTGNMAIEPNVTRGDTRDRYLTWKLKAEGGAVRARVPETQMPGLVTAAISNLNENWATVIADRNRDRWKHRHLPIRDGTAYAQLDPDEHELDLFIGHPVVANDAPRLKIGANYYTQNRWKIQVNNPTDGAIKARVRTNEGWPLFSFERDVKLGPGASRSWTVQPER